MFELFFCLCGCVFCAFAGHQKQLPLVLHDFRRAARRNTISTRILEEVHAKDKPPLHFTCQKSYAYTYSTSLTTQATPTGPTPTYPHLRPTPTRHRHDSGHAYLAYSYLPAPTAYAYSTSTRLLTLIVDWQTGDSPVDVPVLLN